jgi:hypothetical protein
VPPAPAPAAVAPIVADERPATVNKRSLSVARLLRPLASLELTVFLFVLSLLLVFFGTLAQIDNGIGTVMKQYFRWWYVWVPWQLLVQFGQVFFGMSRELKVSGAFPFPAGWTLGTLLLVNLLAAHLVRFKISWKRSGILLIHAGLIVLMLGELFTGLFAVEQRMSMARGETANFTDVSDKVELAITTPSKKDSAKDDVVVIPDRLVRRPGERIADQQLPFDVEVVEFWKNSNLLEPGPNDPDPPNSRPGIDNRFGTSKRFGVSSDKEGSGVDTEMRADVPSARVAFYEKGTDKLIGERFLSLWYYPNQINRQVEFDPITVQAGGVTYEVELRPKREYKDYSITLKEFTHEKYLGTDKPKDFASLIDLRGTDDERREVRISMNAPLRYAGETFYQTSFFPGDSGTVLQVVRNPAWLMPYISCTIVTLGMLVHFGIGLVNFLNRRAAS